MFLCGGFVDLEALGFGDVWPFGYWIWNAFGVGVSLFCNLNVVSFNFHQ